MSTKALLSFMLLFLLLIIESLFPFPALSLEYPKAEENKAKIQQDYLEYFAPALEAINITEIKSYVNDLVSFGTRFTGYAGCYAAADYIERKFKEFGFSNVERHAFSIAVPLDEGAYIETSNGERIRVYPLFPNRVCPPQTPPGGLTGQLIYVKSGDYEEFNGKPIEGSIVVMEFNSQYNWITAAKLGAKAVVFLEPNYTTTLEASMKYTETVSWNFVRVYAKGSEAKKILEIAEKGEYVTLISNMKWCNVESYNIIGYLPGRYDEYILITAQYDSFSFIPSIAPGAREAIGTAIMLQLAKYFAQHPESHKYTLVFIAFSGTNQGIAGSRWFVKKYIDERWQEWGSKVRLQIEIAINDENRYIMPHHISGWTWGWIESVAPWLTDYSNWLFTELIPIIADRLNRNELVFDPLMGKGWILRDLFSSGGPGYGVVYEDYLGSPLRYTNNEPLLLLGGPGIAWSNAYAFSTRYWTPFDLPENINWENIKSNIEVLYPIIFATVNFGASLIGDWAPAPPGYYPKWVDVSGKVMEYNVKTGWWDIPVKDAIIIYTKGGPSSTYGGPEAGFVVFQRPLPAYVMSDENGSIFIPGLMHAERTFMYLPYYIEAYVVDETTGNILYAPGFGRYWYGGAIGVTAYCDSTFTLTTLYQKEQSIGIYTLFKAGTLVLFDVGDIYYRNSAADARITITVNEVATRSPPDQFSWDIYSYGGHGVSVASVFVPPDKPVEIVAHTTYTLRYPMIILTNSTEKNLRGDGWKVKAGEQCILTYTTLRAAIDMRRLNSDRMNMLLARGISPVGFIKTDDLLMEIAQFAEERKYSQVEALSNRLLVFERTNYAILRSLIEDTVYAITFFGLIMVPFAIIFERLFFMSSGVKRVMLVILTYALPLTFLWFFHPGFALASSPLMVIIGFLVIVLVTPLLAVIFNALVVAIKRIRAKMVGIHWIEMPKFSVALLGFSTGVAHMRKRRLLTGLTLIAVTLVTLSISAFTSIGTIKVIKERDTTIPAIYDGILFHQWQFSFGGFTDFGGLGGQSPPQVGKRIINEFRTFYGKMAVIAPRAWGYIGYRERGLYVFNEEGERYKIPIIGVLGMSSEEINVTPVNETLIDGSWFTKDDELVAIIGKNMADYLKVKPGDTIHLGVESIKFKVIGVIDEERFHQIHDLDNSELTPWDPRLPGYENKIWPGEILIIPYKTLLTIFKGWIVSVAIKITTESTNREIIFDIAREIYKQSGGLKPITVYIGFGGKVYVISPESFVTIFGWQQQIILVIISTLVIFSLMISSLEERRREIHVLSSVGLSPFHVAFLFMAESVVYSVVGGLLGYLASIPLVISCASLGLELQLNYASTAVVLSTAMIMIAILAVTLYPVYIASKLITPSYERKWRAPPPKGDKWEIQLPFTATQDEEVDGILSYIYEMIMEHKMEDSKVFRTSLPVKFIEQKTDKMVVRGFEFKAMLAPYDLGIVQIAHILDIKDLVSNRHTFLVKMERMAGSRGSWRTHGREFIDVVRKQILLWRSLEPSKRVEYQKRLSKIISELIT